MGRQWGQALDGYGGHGALRFANRKEVPNEAQQRDGKSAAVLSRNRLSIKGTAPNLSITSLAMYIISCGEEKMKRDWDLIRKLLTDIEEDRDAMAEIPAEPKWTDQSSEEYVRQVSEHDVSVGRIAGHLEMLIKNGYIEGLKVIRTGSGHFGYCLSEVATTNHDWP